MLRHSSNFPELGLWRNPLCSTLPRICPAGATIRLHPLPKPSRYPWIETAGPVKGGPTRPDRQCGYHGHSTRAASASAAALADQLTAELCLHGLAPLGPKFSERNREREVIFQPGQGAGKDQPLEFAASGASGLAMADG